MDYNENPPHKKGKLMFPAFVELVFDYNHLSAAALKGYKTLLEAAIAKSEHPPTHQSVRDMQAIVDALESVLDLSEALCHYEEQALDKIAGGTNQIPK